MHIISCGPRPHRADSLHRYCYLLNVSSLSNFGGYLVWKSSLVWTRGSQPGLILSPGDRRQCLEAFLIVMTRGCYWHRARMLLKVLWSDPTTENYPAHHVHSVRRRGSAVVVMSVDFAVECSHLQNGYNHTIYLIGLLRRFRELRTQDH